MRLNLLHGCRTLKSINDRYSGTRPITTYRTNQSKEGNKTYNNTVEEVREEEESDKTSTPTPH
jgi:hypothetical protein